MVKKKYPFDNMSNVTGIFRLSTNSFAGRIALSINLLGLYIGLTATVATKSNTNVKCQAVHPIKPLQWKLCFY